MMEREVGLKVNERRKKRLVTPLVYFLAEVVMYWLVLSLMQEEFNIRSWQGWSVALLVLLTAYSIAKTVHVYKRQKDYDK